ncbi:hypothetical protein LLG95_06100 [bacterium]|nr:hypothetical protein [bacterium]
MMMKPSLMLRALPLFVLMLAMAMPAFGRFPQADRIPANAMIAVGIENTAATWKKIEALPLTGALSDFLSTGSLTRNLDYQSFLLEKQKAAAKLGFPLTPDEIFTNVFSSVLFYSATNPDGGVGTTIAIIGLKDKAKAGKLLQVLSDESAPAQTSGTLQTDDVKIEKVKIGAAQGWHMTTPEGDEYFYCIAGSNLYIGSTLASMTAAMTPMPSTARRLGSNEQFNRLRQAINWEQADVSVWYDADAMLAMEPQVAELIKDVAGGKSQANKYVVTFNVLRDGIAGRSVYGSDPAPGIPNEQVTMNGLKLIAPAPFFGIDYGLFDSKDIVKEINGLGSSLGAVGAASGMGDLAEKIQSIEESTSISLKNELAPALGTEVVAAINTIKIGMGIPQVDFVLGAKVRNAKLMQQVMTKFERFIEQNSSGNAMIGAALSGDAPTSQTFRSIQADGMTIRTIRIQSDAEPISPSYAITGGYLIIGISPESIQAAGARLQGRAAGLDKSPAYNGLMQMAGSGAHPYNFFVIDLNTIAQKLIRPYVPLFASRAGMDWSMVNVVFDQIIPRVSTFASMDTRQEKLVKSYMKLQMQ